jgi:predicted nucleic acid-binding protein
MQPVLFDSSVYISAFRAGSDAILSLRRQSDTGPVWLSAVVLEELYAGTTSRDFQAIRRLEHDLERARRILIPNLSDWVQAGKAIAQLATRYHFEQIGKGRLTNDALIAMSAGRMGITVITSNARDFAKLAEFRTFRWRVETA